MLGENRQLVTDEPVELRNNQVKFKIAGKLLTILEAFYRLYPKLIKEKPKDVNM